MRILVRLWLLIFLCYVSVFTTERLDGIAAVVGDSIILNSEVEAYLFMKVNQLGLMPDSLEMNILRYRLLDELIEGKVLIVRAEKDTNISVSDEEVEKELERRISYIVSQNRISLKEFKTLIEEKQGIPFVKFQKELRTQIKHEIYKQKIQQFYISSYKVNRSDIEKFYRQYRDSLPVLGESINLSKLEIKLTPSGDTREKAYSKIMLLKSKLDKGEDFAKVASEHSEGPAAANEGDLGYIVKGTLGELTFEKKIFSLKPGKTSEPFETRLGFHIVNILDRKDQKVHVRQLFVKVSPPEEENKKIKILFDSIKTNCNSEDDFVKAVEKFSTDEVSKSRNGQIGWQTVTSMDSEIKNAFDTLALEAISTSVKKENIISIYRINDIKNKRKLSLSEDWNEIAEIAQRIYHQKKLIGLVQKWKEEIFIDIRL